MESMATSKVETLTGRLVARAATSATVTVSANGTQDVDIAFSAFGSTGKPVAISGYGYSGSGFSFLSIYKMLINGTSSKIQLSIRNNRNTDASVAVNVTVLFVE